MRIALVHDWLDTYGGGEIVLANLLRVYPDADTFTLVDFLTDAERRDFGVRRAQTTGLERLPAARRWFRAAAVLYPRIIERLDVRRYDLVISDSHAIAKGVRTHAAQFHVCYCHTPARFAWTMASTYRERAGGGARWREWLAHRAQARFRAWDLAASRRVDRFIANSHHIARAIKTCYGRASDVVYPPVDVDRFGSVGREPRSDYYVTVSRLVPYKRIDLIIEAFRRLPQRKLVVVGEGPERTHLSRDLPSNVTLAGRLDDAHTAAHLGCARAFVFAAYEDFGIAPVEAQAAGTPVIAYREGGSTETIRDIGTPNATGVLYAEQTPAAIVAAIHRFEASTIDADACRINAARFSAPRFRIEIAATIAAIVESGREPPRPARTGT